MLSKIISDFPGSFGHVSRQTKRNIASKYANELARASFFRRLLIRLRIWREILNQAKPRERNPHNLYSQRAFRK